MIEEDHCVYFKQSNDKFLIMILYVDDILMASNNLKMITTTKGCSISDFDMKNMGDVSYMIGVKTYRDQSKRVFGLLHEIYLKNTFERFKMHNLKLILTPVEKNVTLANKLFANG